MHPDDRCNRAAPAGKTNPDMPIEADPADF
jgi:hypothetical protein